MSQFAWGRSPWFNQDAMKPKPKVAKAVSKYSAPREGKNLHGPGGVMQLRMAAAEASKRIATTRSSLYQNQDKLAHRLAGEAHLNAAMSMQHPDRETKEAIDHHLAKAAEHAAAAGGEWDESKHPRDANGKFG